ncbi:MAG: DUF1883 domain-containing protein [Gemmataceae bacterium]
MKFLHWELDTDGRAVVQVELDAQANVMLMDSINFSSYRSGRHFRYFGGHAKQSPVLLSAPHAGHWHVIVDLGGYAGHVNASIRVC